MNGVLRLLLIFGHLLTSNGRCVAFSLPSPRFSETKYPAHKKWFANDSFSKNSAPFKSNVGADCSHPGERKRVKERKRPARIVRILLVVLSTLFFIARPARAIDTRGIAALGARNLSAAALMLVSLAAIPLSITGLPTLSKSLLKSASRCAVQVFFLGSVLLQRIMGASQPLLIMGWIVGVGIIAGKETFSRTQYTYPAMKRHVYVATLSGGLTVLGLSLALGVLGNIHPWYQPGVWIPVAGMLFGNSLSASALGISTITKLFATKQGQIELFLARGATSQEATLPVVRDALLTALTPTINGLAVTGIVHIPGMMTGQILAGQSAPQAAAYQVMINLLIATTACATVQLLVKAAVGALVDSRYHRLYPNQLSLTEKSGSGGKSNLSGTRDSFLGWFSTRKSDSDLSEGRSSSTIGPRKNVMSRSTTQSTTLNELPAVVLEARDLYVARANVNVTFQCRPGDRIGITGRSGAGKSQILRTLSQLEEWNGGELIFVGEPVEKMSTPKYRARVCLVPQSTQILEGTPRMFYEQMLNFHSHSGMEPVFGELVDVLEEMGIETSSNILERQWSTLSGGEAQRVSLAIALSLKPDVLLLDESTSALDESTCKLVEKTLTETGLPIVMVTHSMDQLDRFCTHRIDL
jgi:putative ABC transport system permease protein